MRWLIYVAISVVTLNSTLAAGESKPTAAARPAGVRPAAAVLGASFYIVEASILEGDPNGSIKNGTLKALAAPKVMMVEGEEANVLIGGCIGTQQVDFGTKWKVKVEPADAGKVRVTSVLEISSAGAPADGTVVRIATAVHFAKTLACGERIRVPMSNAENPGRWFELLVQKQPPATD